MLVTPKIKIIYKEIQKKLFYMLPEKWESVYLYASVIQHAKLETGEMFFYYIPKGVLKKNPVNVYEVPSRFNIEEENYLKLTDNLYNKIKELRTEMMLNNEKPWSNITISVEKFNFKVEFRYENLSNSKFSNYDRHLAWKHEYLEKPLSSYTKKEREIIQNFFRERNILNDEVLIYTEPVYAQRNIKSIIDFDKQEDNNIRSTTIDTLKVDYDINTEIKIDKRLQKKIEESVEEVNKSKNQILNC